MITKCLTLDEIEQIRQKYSITHLKYVRIGNEYRFITCDGEYIPNHKNMVEANETVTSAAYCKLYKNRVEIEGNSTTLKAYSAGDDEANITKLLIPAVLNEI